VKLPELDVVCTDKDCEDGVRNTEALCVVSTAIARLLPEATRIETNRNTIRFTLPGENGKKYRVVYKTPEMVREYVRDFDAGKKPKPMKFKLLAPQITEKAPTPKLKAKTPSFKAQDPAKTRRSVRVFGEKAFQ